MRVVPGKRRCRFHGGMSTGVPERLFDPRLECRCPGQHICSISAAVVVEFNTTKTAMSNNNHPLAKMGRPTKYSDEWARQLCDLISQGKSVVDICAMEGQPSRDSVYAWMREREDFSDMYARAREERADLLAAEILEIADTPCTNQVEVAQQRNRLDTRKWLASKLAPRKYGDRVEHDMKGGINFQPAVLVQIGSVDMPPRTISGDPHNTLPGTLPDEE